ncbi:ChrR cupin-like domain protein [Ferrovum sp. JA12]|uniref:cupin domain-containing protein n=1 Tax=Ferrovum sp. JA12 TaxID=1356299 RepID=UPI0007026A6D|nr:cupin domain-containing protein [Ferrovum sp. JA12]KRH78256.1 ChrR cupin-like domain protein [Ferrovum sp. JA12]
MLRVNADFNERVVVETNTLPWIASPQPQIKRKPLDRLGGEIARATSLVVYEPHSSFPEHRHGGGEEILVLKGTFSDESGNYGQGTYIRNPPGTKHSPYSPTGCILFVKLWQFCAEDNEVVRVNTQEMSWYEGLVPGLHVQPLHEHHGIHTALVNWAPNTQFQGHSHPGGEEIFVLEGVFHDEWGTYPKGTWIRSPRYSRHTPFTKSEGAMIYVKTGHLGATYLPFPSIV